MSAMTPIGKARILPPSRATPRVTPRVHPSWLGAAPRVPAALDAPALRKLWEAIDGE